MRIQVAVLVTVLAACGADVAVVHADGEADEGSVTTVSTEGNAELELVASQLQWPTLREGEQSDVVVALQYLLRHAGRTLTVDGDFGGQTAAALRGLALASPVNAAGWSRLTPPLRAGDSNDAVRAVQHLLREKYAMNLAVTGLIGPTTSDAIVAFQLGRCLAADGAVGPFTWNALVSGATQCAVQSSNAQGLLAAHRAGSITLWDQTFGRFDGADPLSNITDAAAGRAARTSCHGGAPCGRVTLHPAMLNGLLRLNTRFGHRLFVTTISGGAHSANSYHYAGRAFDVDEVDGVRVLGFVAQPTAHG